MEWLETALTFLRIAGPASYHGAEHVPMPVLGDERQRRSYLEGGKSAHLFRRSLDVVPEKPQDVGGLLDFVKHRAPIDVLDGMKLVLKRCADAEIATAATEGPEQIGIVTFAAMTILPSAVTTSADIKLSSESPRPRVR